jgi:hypothetical protein
MEKRTANIEPLPVCRNHTDTSADHVRDKKIDGKCRPLHPKLRWDGQGKTINEI